MRELTGHQCDAIYAKPTNIYINDTFITGHVIYELWKYNKFYITGADVYNGPPDGCLCVFNNKIGYDFVSIEHLFNGNPLTNIHEIVNGILKDNPVDTSYSLTPKRVQYKLWRPF